jgi:HEPN domain-containing protein
MAVFRKDFKKLAEVRLKEARVLLKSSLWGGAYLLAGTAVECAIKACLAKKTRRYEFPDKAFANDCFKHDPTALLKLAELIDELDQDMRADAQLAADWASVKDWKIESRYDPKITKNKAADMVRGTAGVLQWLGQRW